MLEAMYEDAVLLGVGKSAFKLAMHQLVDGLDCAYAEKRTVDGDRTKTE